MSYERALKERQALWKQDGISQLVEALRPREVFLVGGAVRDLILGRAIKDFDFLFDGSATLLLSLQSHLQEVMGATVIVLDSEFGILRVCRRGEEDLDLAACQGDTVLQDLARRDITFNAMAIDSQGRLLDPFDGCRDLDNGLVRLTSPRVLKDDPLRVLRCLRLAAELHFGIERSTREQMGLHVRLLEQVAGERIWEELQRFFRHADFSLMEMAREVRLFSTLFDSPEEEFPWRWLAEWWSQSESGPRLGFRTSRGRLVSEALLSIGDPSAVYDCTQTRGDDATMMSQEARFVRSAKSKPKSQEAVLSILAALLFGTKHGAQENALERLRLSKAQTRYLQQWWAACWALLQSHPATTREVYQWLSLAPSHLEQVLSFTTLRAFGRPVDEALAERLLLAASGQGELRWEPLPVDGDILCRHVKRKPGPWVGQLLGELRAAWACREVDNIDGLLNLARQRLDTDD